jgi:hypothetical protein
MMLSSFDSTSSEGSRELLVSSLVWVRGAAIRPVPSYAVVGADVLDQVERELASDTEQAKSELDDAFARFERTQPQLADRISQVLARPLDETALALGYFLTISIWLAFERTFSARLGEVSEDALRATEDALALEEELRAKHGDEPLDLDDVVSIEQPGVLGFVHEHVDAALDVAARAEAAPGDEGDVDVDDVHTVYRSILVLTLSLSHAVRPTAGMRGSAELLA